MKQVQIQHSLDDQAKMNSASTPVNFLSALVRLGRLKFLIYSPVFYAIGVAAAVLVDGHTLNKQVALNGVLFTWAAHATTHFWNEYYDYETDRKHKDPSPWTGGSRVLVEGLITLNQCLGIAWLATILMVCWIYVLYEMTEQSYAVATSLALLIFFSVQYSAPPFKMSTNKLGEVDGVLVLNIILPICGYHLQAAGNDHCWKVPAHLWMVLVPAALVQFVRLMVMNMADIESDILAKKITFPAHIGLVNAQRLHNVGMFLAYVALVIEFFWMDLPLIHFIAMMSTFPAALYQMKQVPRLPWVFENPFWSSMHNASVLVMSLVGMLITAAVKRGQVDSDILLISSVLIPVTSTFPVLLSKMRTAISAHDKKMKNA